MQTPFYRIYQFILRIAANFLGIHEPYTIKDVGILFYVPETLIKYGYKHPLIVTDKGLYSLGMHEELVKFIKEKGLDYSLYFDVVANPTIKNVNDGLKIYKEEGCDSIVALGGGSAMDCAKVIGALAVNPKKKVEDLKGLLHVHHKIPFFIAIPTTAGTGSETTLAAVIVNEETHHKYAINDPHLIPNYAVFDPKLLLNLPGKVTSTTGMDALTHAVEAYIGRSNTRKTKRCAKEAVKLIYDHLYESYKDPHDYLERIAMQEAAFKAGIAFTRAYVGYVHAIAHSLGGKYNVPHGLANAIILPYVLESFGKKAYRKLAQLSDVVSLCEKTASKEEKAKAFIAWIRELNKKMEIPEKFDISYDENAVDEMAKNAFKEGNPLYPVPREFSMKDFKDIYR
ncbi:MAG: iron-containing alcohol dehydrogenase, partial [Firmicutes bacterium]|nr:iron-containing alcohol dehydrogenase [Candidatus Fiminaster equi]